MMDDDNLMDVNFTDLDLNQEPVAPAIRSVARVGSLLNELETDRRGVEERLRQLQEASTRARQRQRWRRGRNSIEISHISSEMMVDVDAGRGILDGINNMGMVDMTAEKGKGYKRDSSHLVAEALEMDSQVKKADKEGGSFYDCNICLDLARDPVLTCCGHLFCWACFYQVPNVDSASKECPVCKGEVSDSTVIPIYGNGDSECVRETESGLKIPPRPKARRVDSVRQQRVTGRLSHVPVAEALRRIRISIGAMVHQTQQQDGGGTGVVNSDVEPQEWQIAEAAVSRRSRIRQVSRVLSESAASLSSLSSALSNAERLVETVINNRVSQNDTDATSIDVGNSLGRQFAVLESDNQPDDDDDDDADAADADADDDDIVGGLPISSIAEVPGLYGNAVQILSLGSPYAPVARSYSLRRRSHMSRTSDVNSQDTREPRRRRLN